MKSKVSKLLIETIDSFLKNEEQPNFKVSGSPLQVETFIKVLNATKTFNEEINKSDATLKSIVEKFNLKSESAANFKLIFGTKWPL